MVISSEVFLNNKNLSSQEYAMPFFKSSCNRCSWEDPKPIGPNGAKKSWSRHTSFLYVVIKNALKQNYLGCPFFSTNF